MDSRQLIKYGLVGTISTLIHFIVSASFIFFIAPSLLLSNILGFLIAFIWSYYVQSKFVFQSGLSTRKGLKFFLVQAIALLIAVGLADRFETVSIYLKIFMVLIFLPLASFFIHKFWTFVEK